jgi:hypothetical protein
MGFGDERGRHLEKYQPIAEAIGEVTLPDMRVVPGGGHLERRRQREEVARNSAIVLHQLVADGLITFEALQERYTGEQ